LVLETFHTDYFRVNPREVGSRRFGSQISHVEIGGDQYETIERVLDCAKKIGYSAFLSSLGFNVDGFSSPRLQRLTSESGVAFRRKYVLVKAGRTEYLFVLSAFPANSSFNRTFDVGWLFPISKSPVSDEIVQQLIAYVRKIAISLGVSVPGVLVLRAKNARNAGVKAMRWTVAHPDVLKWFAVRNGR
jgi:hypothetical protein